MSNQAPVTLENISKTYEIWTNPMARLKSPMYRRAAVAAQNAGSSGLAARFRSRADSCVERIQALKPVSIEVQAGEAFGILGRNGGGKSTLLQIAAGTLRPTTGSIDVRGRISALLQLGSGFNPEFTGRENVMLNAAVLGVSRAEVKKRFNEVLEFAEIGSFIDCPLRTYSSGMQMRLAFAVQVMLDPDVLIIDEALAVGDIFFQQKCYTRLRDLLHNGTCVLFVSHSMHAVQQFCDRALVLDQGNPIFIGDADEAVRRYQINVQAEPSAHSETDDHESITAEISSGPSTDELDDQINISIEPPKPHEWINVREDQQIGTGHAWIRKLAITDQAGNAIHGFDQGQYACIWYEIEAINTIVNPSTAISLSSRQGELIHSKHSIQHRDLETQPSANVLRSGETMVVCQQVKLSLGPDEYTVGAAIISVPDSCWDGDRINEHSFNEQITRHAWTSPIASIHVGPLHNSPGHFVTHYGLVDLDGSTQWNITRTLSKTQSTAEIDDSKPAESPASASTGSA
ncbi:MAG: ABC transporter ATP-binding protein [Phycisphaerales bacterium]